MRITLGNLKRNRLLFFTTAYKNTQSRLLIIFLSPMMKSALQRCYRNWSLSGVGKSQKANEEEKTEKKVVWIFERINLRKDEKIIVVDVNVIYYAEASEKNTLVYTIDGEYTMPMSISGFTQNYQMNFFINVIVPHNCSIYLKFGRSYLWFNQTYLLRLLESALKAEITVSHKKVKKFKQIMEL